jgi:hypothetical protein
MTEFGCVAYVNGVRLADTELDYVASAPTVLEGLRVTWGRATVNDQPESATCGFTIRDRDPDADLIALVHAGDLVDVYCETSDPDPAPVDVAVEGGFEQTPPAGRVASVAAKVTQTSKYVFEGGRALLYSVRSTAVGGSYLLIPPAPWSPDPAGWEVAVPPIKAGDSWTLRVRVRAGDLLTPATVRYRLVTFGTAAAPGAPYRYPAGEQVVAVPAGGWTTITVPAVFDAADDGRWPGLYLSAESPTWTATAGTWAAAAGTWADRWTAVYVDKLEAIAPASAVDRRAVFRGRITDLALEAADEGAVMSVTATDLTADLANDLISDDPWPESTAAARGAAIQAQTRTAPALIVDPRPGALMVTWRDVDAQPALGLFQELAVSADAALWGAYSAARGFYLWLEDTWARESLAHLSQDPGTGVITITGNNPNTAAGVVLDACDVLRDGVSFEQDAGDVITVVDVSWSQQAIDETSGLPAPLEQHELTQDDDGIGRYGPRRASLTTQLSRQADAMAIGSHVLARGQTLQWHATGVTWDLEVSQEWDDTLRAAALTLLDGTQRIGCPLTITDLPAWVPEAPALSAYVDGGQYTFTGGRWILALSITSATAAGHSIPWRAAAPAWRWRDFDPSVTWAAMWGVGS